MQPVIHRPFFYSLDLRGEKKLGKGDRPILDFRISSPLPGPQKREFSAGEEEEGVKYWKNLLLRKVPCRGENEEKTVLSAGK